MADKVFKFVGYKEMEEAKLVVMNHKASELKKLVNDSHTGEWLGFDKRNKAYLLKYSFAINGDYQECLVVLDEETDKVLKV